MQHEKARQFRTHLEKVSNIILTGHEHETELYTQTSRDVQSQYMQGGPLQGDKGVSSFKTLIVDLKGKKQQYIEFSWSNGLYKPCPISPSWDQLPINKALKQDRFTNNNEYQRFLREPGVPYKHPRKNEDLILQDLYIFPNLEVRQPKISKQPFVVNSADVPNFIFDEKRALIIGSNTSGKTSFLKMMYLYLADRGIVPLMVDGKEITSPKEDKLKAKLIEKFERQYSSEYVSDYFQLENKDRAILIDDLDAIPLNSRGKALLIDNLIKYYDRIIIVTDNLFELEEIIKEDPGAYLVEFKHCEILEFGDFLTHQLIEKWCILGLEYEVGETELSHRLKTILDTVKTILGPNVLPSYPFFLLTIIQSCEQTSAMNIPLNKECGAFGYYYEWLITYALSVSAKKIFDLDAKYKYLSELAYSIFEKKETKISEASIAIFHADYCARHALDQTKDFHLHSMIDDLVLANMLAEENGWYRFQYRYIYYYFIARAIDTKLQDPKTRPQMVSTVNELASRIFNEINSAILLFLSYKSRDPIVRNTILENGQSILKGKDPCDLCQDVAFINKLNLSTTYILPGEKPQEVREQYLKRIDESRTKPDIENEAIETSTYDELLLPIKNGIMTVGVLGQIVKNFAGSLEGVDKNAIVKECYLLGLRTLKYVLELMEQSVSEFQAYMKEYLIAQQERGNAAKPEHQRTYKTDTQLQMEVNVIAFIYVDRTIYSVIKIIARAVGLERLGPVLDQVRNELDSLPARLIDTTIKLEYYRRMPMKEIFEIDDLLQRNSVVYSVFKHIVWNRLALWECDRVERQQICAKLQMPVAHPRLLEGPKRKIEG